MAENADVLVMGAGVSDLMRILSEVKQGVKIQYIQLIVEAIEHACHAYNHIWRSRRAVAALHIIC